MEIYAKLNKTLKHPFFASFGKKALPFPRKWNESGSTYVVDAEGENLHAFDYDVWTVCCYYIYKNGDSAIVTPDDVAKVLGISISAFRNKIAKSLNNLGKTKFTVDCNGESVSFTLLNVKKRKKGKRYFYTVSNPENLNSNYKEFALEEYLSYPQGLSRRVFEYWAMWENTRIVEGGNSPFTINKWAQVLPMGGEYLSQKTRQFEKAIAPLNDYISLEDLVPVVKQKRKSLAEQYRQQKRQQSLPQQPPKSKPPVTKVVPPPPPPAPAIPTQPVKVVSPPAMAKTNVTFAEQPPQVAQLQQEIGSVANQRENATENATVAKTHTPQVEHVPPVPRQKTNRDNGLDHSGKAFDALQQAIEIKMEYAQKRGHLPAQTNQDIFAQLETLRPVMGNEFFEQEQSFLLEYLPGSGFECIERNVYLTMDACGPYTHGSEKHGRYLNKALKKNFAANKPPEWVQQKKNNFRYKKEQAKRESIQAQEVNVLLQEKEDFLHVVAGHVKAIKNQDILEYGQWFAATSNDEQWVVQQSIAIANNGRTFSPRIFQDNNFMQRLKETVRRCGENLPRKRTNWKGDVVNV